MAGKRKRFEIFKRDGFTCQYCGQRPPDVTLELDHIHPRSKGGTDDDINLTTSCWDCNRGKSDKVLGEVQPKPDADLKFLETQQEIAEVNRYLRSKETRDKAFSRLLSALQDIWVAVLTTEYVPLDRQWRAWLAIYSPAEIETSIYAAAPGYAAGKFSRVEASAVGDLVRYVSAVLRNRKREAGDSNGNH